MASESIRKSIFSEWLEEYGPTPTKYLQALEDPNAIIAFRREKPSMGRVQVADLDLSKFPPPGKSFFIFANPRKLKAAFEETAGFRVGDDGTMHTALGYYALWLRVTHSCVWRREDFWAGDDNAPGGKSRKATLSGNGFDYESKFRVRREICKMDKYLAAIRTKPFVILAGISGTGKSRLARQLARGCCPADSRLAFEDDAKTVPAKKPGNFEMIPVRPNWHDSSELVGYVTRITEDDRPQYVLTPFVKFLVRAMLNPDVPFVLCLDEMNLAPVEQYFAEYLSAIETREWIDPADPTKGWTTDVFVRFDVAQIAGESGSDPTDNFVRATTEALLAGLGDGEAVAAVRAQILADRGLRIPRNLVVVGTVNMDETTCSFSRKVLDRAMTFELNETDGLYSVASIAGEGPLAYGILGADATRTQFLSAKDACESPLGLTVADAPSGKTLAEAILDALKEVNAVLEDTPFKIAYRTRNEILAYCLERTAGAHATLPQALDEAIGMKILSRIEGDDQRLTVYVRDAQGGVQAKPLLETLGAAIGAALRDAAFGGETGAEGCAKKLAFMSARLEGGFTNYFV